MLTDTIPETAIVFTVFGAGEARSRRRRDPLARPLCFFLSLVLSNIFSRYCPFLNLLILGCWRSNLSLRRRRLQRHMKPVLAVSLSTCLILLCSTVSVSTLVLSVNCISGESPEEPYPGACSQLLMVECKVVSPWRRFISSLMIISAPVGQLAVLDFSSCPRPPLGTDLDCHRQLPSSTTLSPMIVLPKGNIYSVLLWCGRGNGLDIFTPDLATTHITFATHDGQSLQMLTSQCVDSQKPFPAPLADLILRVKGHRPECSQDRLKNIFT